MNGQAFVHERGRIRYWLTSKLLRSLQERNYDLSIALKGGYDPLSAWISIASQANQRAGYIDAKPRRLAFAYTQSLASAENSAASSGDRFGSRRNRGSDRIEAMTSPWKSRNPPVWR